MCVLNGNSSSPLRCHGLNSQHASHQRVPWNLMAAAQLLFGLGSAPIQPLGISYIDDFAEPGNSALYIGMVCVSLALSLSLSLFLSLSSVFYV